MDIAERKHIIDEVLDTIRVELQTIRNEIAEIKDDVERLQIRVFHSYDSDMAIGADEEW